MIMATNIFATPSQSSNSLGGILGLTQSDLQETTQEDGGNFLSFMLSSLGEESSTDSTTAILNSIVQNQTTENLSSLDLESLELDDSLKSLQLEEATFVQILQLLEHLNGGEEVTTLPKLDDKLNLLLKDASVLEEFKSANSLKDVMELSQKYDLGLEKITVTKSDVTALKEAFPNLETKGFFKELQTSISSQDILKNSKQQSTQSTPSETSAQKPTQTLTSVLQNITNPKQNQNQNNEKPQTVTNSANHVNIEETEEVEEVVVIKKQSKSEKLNNTNINNTIPDNTTPKNVADKSTTNKLSDKLNGIPNNQNGEKIVSTNTQQPKENTEKTDTKIQTQELKLPTQDQSSETKNETREQNQKQDSNQNTSFVKEVNKADTLQVKSSSLKQTLNSFAQEFKEKIEEYKPPIMKVKMALNPKELGEMDVTIVNRGNNLQVSITSNTSAMNLFLQNQAEFKNSLVNMGFTNLEMNFSDQRQSGEQNQNGTEFASHSDEDEEYEEYATENTILEVVIPDYV